MVEWHIQTELWHTIAQRKYIGSIHESIESQSRRGMNSTYFNLKSLSNRCLCSKTKTGIDINWHAVQRKCLPHFIINAVFRANSWQNWKSIKRDGLISDAKSEDKLLRRANFRFSNILIEISHFTNSSLYHSILSFNLWIFFVGI